MEYYCLAPEVGLEPTTQRLTAVCSTTELLRIAKVQRRLYLGRICGSTTDIYASPIPFSILHKPPEVRIGTQKAKNSLRKPFWAKFVGTSTIDLPWQKYDTVVTSKVHGGVRMNAIDSHLKEVWWLLMLRGIALILFGIIAVLWPGLTLLALATAFAAFLLISGVIDIITGIRAEGKRSLWFLTMILGFAEVGLGVFLLKNGLVLATFIALIGFTILIIGIIQVIAAFEPGEDAGRRFLNIIVGVLGVIAGFAVLRYPVSSGLAFTWILGVWALVAGAIQIAMCLSVRQKVNAIAAS
jgi:uncharacterized membrane protein HdeD (DUF308 family)